MHQASMVDADQGWNRMFVNDNVWLDLPTLIETRLIVQANSGGGKSFLLRRMLEQSHGLVQHLIIVLANSNVFFVPGRTILNKSTA
jgi:hypothetical protein